MKNKTIIINQYNKLNEKYVHMQKIVMGQEKPKMDIPCLQCPNFGKVLNQPITEDQIKGLIKT